MRNILRFLLLLIVSVTVACGKTKEEHVFENATFTIPFKFKGYVVDNGEGRWVYFLNGDSDGIEIRHDAALMIPDNLIVCPVEMEVEAQKVKIKYSLPIDSEAIYSRQDSEKCVTHYSLIFQELSRKSKININSYKNR